MENSYGIGVRNRYELFYDDDVDPLDLIKQTEKTKEPKSAEKENKKGPTTAKTKELKATNNKKGEKGSKTENAPKITDKTNPPATQNKGPRSTEGRVKFSDREERNNRRNRVEGEFRDAPPPRFEGESRGAMSRGRGRGMGRGRGRGRGGALEGGPDNRGKRQYDRQSGMATTGVKSVDKRDGSGAFNWGSDKDQIEEQLNAAPATNSDHDTSTENVEKPPEETPPTEEGVEGAPPKEDDNAKEMTLDEWKAMQGNRHKPQFNIRRAGEGENQAQWKKTYVLRKKEEEESDEEEDEEEEEEVHHGRRKVLLDIDFQFSDSPARGRGRGRGRGGPGRGRGMDRGGRGGGGGDRGDRDRGDRGDRGDRMDRGGRGERRGGSGLRGRGMSRQEAPKMDDERDFPSLG